MNIKSYNFICNNDDKVLAFISLGDCLRQARESIGFSQQKIADSLYLKLSVIKGIEEGCLDTLEMTSTFLCGYIRSYARLVCFNDEEMIVLFIKRLQFLPVMSVQKSYGVVDFLKKYRKKIRLLIIICFVSVIITVFGSIMWRSTFLFFKERFFEIFSLSSVRNSYVRGLGESHLLSFLNVDSLNRKSFGLCYSNSIYSVSDLLKSFSFLGDDIFCIFDKLFNDIEGYVLYKGRWLDFDHGCGFVKGIYSFDNNVLIMNFTSDCWLEVFDARGKRLYVGTQNSGNVLTLQGKIPYKLVIGAPQSIKIRYQGDVIDLNQFIHPYRVARLIIPDQ